MTKIKYVCISDLHLGAPNSLFTNIHPHIKDGTIVPDPQKSTQSLDAFADALFEFLPDLSDPGNPPTLIISVVYLDLGFTPAHQVVMAFQRFVEKIFPENKPPLFAQEILFIAGNHDHQSLAIRKDAKFCPSDPR
ncbi:MAG: hypothetical protein U5K54_09315 [Cytophagales bacterium]|nr:hypothetical protein [Cytophagales bacterium]